MKKLARFKNKKIYLSFIYFFISVIFLTNGYVVYTLIQKGRDVNRRDTLGVVDTQEEEKKDSKKIVKYSTKTPDETPVSNYTVDDDMPLYIHIPRLERIGYIQQVGVDQNKQIAVPNNIYMGGWYINSVKPGKNGLSIIDGHRDGQVNKGLFFNLETLIKGDIVEIKYGNGDIYRFKVKKVIQVKEKEAKKYLFSKDPKIKKQLNLVSCVGNYLFEKETYDKRIIVVTEGV